MNARLLALTLCSLSILIQPGLVHAQDANADDVAQRSGSTNGATAQPGAGGSRGMRGFGGGGSFEEGPMFDIQIENGKLSLAPLADRPGLTNFWAPGTKSVPATMENISRYLRATDPHLSVILSPGTGDITISNLKIKTAVLPQISEALIISSDNKLSGNGGMRGRSFFPASGGPNGRQQIGDSTITFVSRQSESQPVMEVFNLSGYIQTLGKVDDKVIREKIDELQDMTHSTLVDLGMTWSTDVPNFKYHPGTKLLIVVGKPEAIDVTRKIVNALSGQQKNGREDLLLDVTQPSEQK